MIEQAALFGVKLVAPLIRIYRALLPKRRQNLIFVAKPLGTWASAIEGEDGRRIFQVCALFAVTNDSQEKEAWITRLQVQFRYSAFAFWRPLEDCLSCDIGDARVILPTVPGALIAPHTTATIGIAHLFNVARLPEPRAKALFFRIVVTDQFGERHSKRVRLGKPKPQ